MNPLQLTISLLFLLFNFCIHAQSYEGAEAEKIIPGTKSVLMGDQSEVPTFVVFNEDQQIPVQDFEKWERKNFQLSDGVTFSTTKTVEGKGGLSHQFRMQYYQGIPIDHALSVIHSKDGKVTYFNGDIHNKITLPVVPVFQRKGAINTALTHLNIDPIEWEQAYESEKSRSTGDDQSPAQERIEEKLVIYPYEGNYYLAWKIEISSRQFGVNKYVYTDAQKGNVIKDQSSTYQCNGGGAVTSWRGTQGIDTDFVGNFRLHNDCGNRDIRTRNIAGNAIFTDNDNFWGSTNNLFIAAQSVHFGVSAAYDYYLGEHQLEGMDGSGTVNAFIELGLENAFFTGNSLNIRFGLGANNGNDNDDRTTPDICGHEYTHGVLFHTGGITNTGHETLSLHEGISDIFGNESEALVDNAAPDWSYGDELVGPNVRFLNTPNNDVHNTGNGSPDTYLGNFWNGGFQHVDGGVVRFWYFLLSQGGSGTNDNGNFYNVQGIGHDAAAEVLYEAISSGSFGAGPSYFTARAATIQAATTLSNGTVCSNLRRQVTNAWYAVGVGGAHTPDFRLTNLTSTSGNSVAVTGTMTVDYNLITNSNSFGNTSTYVGFYLRPYCSVGSNSYDPIDVEVENLICNGTNNVQSSITVPSGTATGWYTLVAKVDAFNWVTETAEWNNIDCINVNITPQTSFPDLRPQSASASPTTILAGNTTNATVTLRNNGNASAGSSRMNYYLSSNSTYSTNDVYLGYRNFGGLSPGATFTGSKTLTIPSNTGAGNYYIVYRADANNWVNESNEYNNTTYKYITVTAPPSNMPDLIINNVNPAPGNSTPPFVGYGDFVNVTYTLANQNSGTNAGSSTTRMYLSLDLSVGSGDYLLQTAWGQSPGSKSATIQVPYGIPFNYYNILIVADYYNAVTESSEINNIGYGHLYVSNFFNGGGDNGIVSKNPNGESANSRTNTEAEEDLEKSTEIKVFPNPTRDQFTLEYPIQKEETVAISIYSGTGQLIDRVMLETSSQTGQWQYNGHQLPSGLYYISWQAGDDNKLAKLVVE